MLTSALLRLALKRLTEVVCSSPIRSIRVVVHSSGTTRAYAVHISAEYQAQVYGYLADHTEIGIPPPGSPLLLTTAEAYAAINLANKAWLETHPDSGVQS